MKLFFLKDDTLYKIFTTLEKIPKGGQVEILIESGNQFFNNPRWAKQIDSIVTKRSIHTTFIAQNDRQKNFFVENNINFELKRENKVRIFFNMLYWFFFNIKKFHLKTFQNKNYSFFAIFWLEILLLLGAWYTVYSLILPETVITLTPSYNINEIIYNFRYLYPQDFSTYPYTGKHISLQINTGSIDDVTIQTTINKNPNRGESYIKGKVRITNTLSTPLSLLENTQFVDSNGIEYVSDWKVYVPGAQWKDQAGVGYADLTSKATPENDELIKRFWDSITIWQELLIKKLWSSIHTKQVYAQSIEGFTIWRYTSTWVIDQIEIDELKKDLYNTLDAKKKTLLKSASIEEWWILLPFDNFISLQNCSYSLTGNTDIPSELESVAWSIHCDIIYGYVKKEDLVSWVTQYVTQRSTNSRKIIGIQDNIVNFFDFLTWDYNAYIIPTRINVIESYNLQADTNNILKDLKDQIAGKTKLEAWQILQTIPEIEQWVIHISPFWYDAITSVKSRIRIKIKPQG